MILLANVTPINFIKRKMEVLSDGEAWRMLMCGVLSLSYVCTHSQALVPSWGQDREGLGIYTLNIRPCCPPSPLPGCFLQTSGDPLPPRGAQTTLSPVENLPPVSPQHIALFLSL